MSDIKIGSTRGIDRSTGGVRLEMDRWQAQNLLEALTFLSGDAERGHRAYEVQAVLTNLLSDSEQWEPPRTWDEMRSRYERFCEGEDGMAKKSDKPSPKTFEGACRLLSKRYDEAQKGESLDVWFSRQEMRDILVGLLEDVEGRNRSLSVGHVKTALMHLEKADDALILALLSGPAPERDPEVYELTGPFLRQVTGSVRHARSCVEEALNDEE